MSRTAALSGTLGDLPLPDLFALLGATASSGVLSFEGPTRATLVVHEGQLTLGLSDDGPNLQEVLLGTGVVGVDACERAQSASLTGATLADALVAEGADPDELAAVLREQVVSTVFELLLAPEDTFAFLPGATHPLGGRFAVEPDGVLDEAGERVAAWRVIAETIPSTAAVLRLCRSLPGPDVTIDADDWRVLSCLDGRATVADVVEQVGLSAFSVCGVLHRLVGDGIVEHADA